MTPWWIFSKVVGEQLYAATYGMMSESIHGSWNESMGYCLRRNDDGTFSTFPFYQAADIRFVTPTRNFCSLPFRLWLARIEVDDKYLFEFLNWGRSRQHDNLQTVRRRIRRHVSGPMLGVELRRGRTPVCGGSRAKRRYGLPASAAMAAASFPTSTAHWRTPAARTTSSALGPATRMSKDRRSSGSSAPRRRVS